MAAARLFPACAVALAACGAAAEDAMAAPSVAAPVPGVAPPVGGPWAQRGDQVMLQVSARGGISRWDTVCANLPEVELRCSTDGCTVLADKMRGRSCNDYCDDSGLVCVGAWEEVNEDCAIKMTLTCDDASIPTSDLLCRCAEPGSSATVPAPAPPSPGGGGAGGEKWPLETFFWNVHWECSMAASGASRSCRKQVESRFVELAKSSQAQVVASVELSTSMSNPASLVWSGLWGWKQVDGPCKSGSRGDSVALAFAPGWSVLASGGGCLRYDSDTRAFAVARVTPPRPVEGCPSLCFVALHAPHSSITRGKEDIERICGSAVEHCAVAMGDWNTPVSGVHGLWADLIGGLSPTAAFPDERTCCWPEAQHYGVFDHLATNIPGAVPGGHTVHPYQLLEETPMKQHRAVSATVMLPGSASVIKA